MPLINSAQGQILQLKHSQLKYFGSIVADFKFLNVCMSCLRLSTRQASPTWANDQIH